MRVSYRQRNTFFFFFIFLIVGSAGGYYNIMHYPKEVKALEKQIKQMQTNYTSIEERRVYLEEVYNTIEQKRDRLSNLDKVVPSGVSLNSTFKYLDKIQTKFGALKFSLTSNESSHSDVGYGYEEFTLTGEGTYRRIFNLLYVLEKGPQLFIVDQVNVRGVETWDADLGRFKTVVPFTIIVRAMYADLVQLPEISRTITQLKPPQAYDLFRPAISTNLPQNVDQLLETERAELRAILPDKAIVADADGTVHMLHEGDKVYLGYVTKIDQQNSLIEFTLNKGGIVEKFILRLKFGAEGEDENTPQ